MKKLTTAIIALALAFLGLSLSTPAFADSNICNQTGVSNEVKKANGCSGYGDQAEISEVVVGIINGVVGIMSLVAVVFIIVGGVNYMTSAGDSGKIEKAKKTILYAIIGLIISVLAFAIINFVVGNVLK